MTMRGIINDFGKKTVDGYKPDTPCRFSAPEDTLGMLDTSYNSSGTSGIAFLKDKIRVCRGGEISDAYYCDIKSVQIIPSCESTYEDEISLFLEKGSLKITDCAINKFFLKQLIESLLRVYPTTTESERRAECEEYFSKSEPVRSAEIREELEKNAKASEVIIVEKEPEEISKKDEKENIPEKSENIEKNAVKAAENNEEDKKPETENAITDEKIEWIGGDKDKLSEAEKNNGENNTGISHNETISYLVDSINEINTAAKINAEAMKREELAKQEAANPAAANFSTPTPRPTVMKKDRLTIEPESEDIYIQASRRIRGLCESGKLSMREIERALKEQLIPTAEKFSDLTVTTEGLDPEIAAKTEELKVASDRLPEYFKLSEDIAARVMFYMLFVMLTCIDRIAQTPETKRQLNLFFVSYGTAGISFSMLETGM